MKSMNNWLTFSLQSPHLTLDAVKQQTTDGSVSHQSANARITTVVNNNNNNNNNTANNNNNNNNNSLIFSNMSQNHSTNLGGYQSSANDCYNSLRGSSGDGGNNSNSGQGLEMMRSDGSLCIMEALSRSHSSDQHWPQQRAMQSDGGVQQQQQQQHTLLTPDQLSRLTGNADTSNKGQQLTSSHSHSHSHSHYDMQANASTDTRDGPKLEDFLGGASLGGQYSDREAAQQQAQLDSLYYNPTGNANYASHRSDNTTQSRINVNLPYSSSARGGGGSLHDVPPSYHVAYGGGVPDGSSSLTHPYDHPHSQETSNNNSLQLAGNRMHAQNLLQAALDQSATAELLSECALQLPQGGSPSAGGGDEYGLKTWLRHQAAAEKAGQQQRGLNALATLQPLTLSMSAGSHQSSVSTPVHASGQLVAGESPTGPEPRKRGAGRAGSKEPSPRKSIDTFGQRTSVYRGVTRHRWTGRYEAHLWDNSCRKEGQTRKGRQVYLGGYDKEEKAARAYDLAALKYWGASTTINFPLTTYETELEEMKNMSRQEYVASLRRKSSGFSRGASMYRGVTRHHQHGRWQARIGRVAGNKDLYLGTYSTQEEAAEAYDIAAIKFRGINAVTNFDISRYDAARIQQASVNGHHGQEAMKAAKEAELAAAMSIGTASAHAAQSRAHTAAHALSHGAHGHPHVEGPDDHQTASTHSVAGTGTGTTPGSQLTTEGGSLSTQGAGLSKNLHEWQMLYQQQTRNTWTTSQEDTRHLGVSFTESMRAPTSNTNKFNPPTNGMLLRNLMGLEALPQDQHHNTTTRADQAGSCSANQQQGLLMPGSTGSMISTSGYQGGAYGGQQGQGSVDRGAVVDSPKNSVGESEEASSKSSGYDPVGVLYMSPGPNQGKLAGYETNPLTPWISSNPATVQGLAGRSNLSIGGHMGSGPIFAHSWNE